MELSKQEIEAGIKAVMINERQRSSAQNKSGHKFWHDVANELEAQGITLIDKIAYMKAIVIQPTKGNTGFTASVVGMKNYQSIAADEITALKQLVEKLEKKNPKFIIRPEYTEY